MKRTIIVSRFAATVVVIVFLLSIGFTGCTKNKNEEGEKRQQQEKIITASDGSTITFPQKSDGLNQIQTTVAKKGRATFSVIAPTRVVAIISTTVTTNDKFILFDSPDVTTLYSQYRQSKVNVARADKNYERMKDMYKNMTATAKDLTESETDAANAHASNAEIEGRLRGLGFDPIELEKASSGTMWMISDVSETQLREVQKGEDVDIYFSSFPEKKYIGKAEAIGEVIDPVTRTVKVRVTMTNYKNMFRPGMFARVDFGDPTDGVLLLPASSVITVDGKDYVFVETEQGKFRRQAVTLGNSTAAEVVILSGVEDGSKVVSSGTMLLKGLSFGF